MEQEKVHGPQGVSSAGSLLVAVVVVAAAWGSKCASREQSHFSLGDGTWYAALVPSLRLTTKHSPP